MYQYFATKTIQCVPERDLERKEENISKDIHPFTLLVKNE